MIAASRWIDSICYYTMIGESLYHQGKYAEALDNYNAALRLQLAYPNWMAKACSRCPPAWSAAQSHRGLGLDQPVPGTTSWSSWTAAGTRPSTRSSTPTARRTCSTPASPPTTWPTTWGRGPRSCKTPAATYPRQPERGPWRSCPTSCITTGPGPPPTRTAGIPTDDVYSLRFAWLTNGKVPPSGLKPHDDLLAHFPYLGVPNPQKSSS